MDVILNRWNAWNERRGSFFELYFDDDFTQEVKLQS